MQLKKLVLVISLAILSACSLRTQPVEQTQTAIVLQQQQLELTQAALSLEPTQTALAAEQATLSAQIAANQTRAANPNPVITRNADWMPVERDFDGVTMVLVPAGCFTMKGDQILFLIGMILMNGVLSDLSGLINMK